MKINLSKDMKFFFYYDYSFFFLGINQYYIFGKHMVTCAPGSLIFAKESFVYYLNNNNTTL